MLVQSTFLEGLSTMDNSRVIPQSVEGVALSMLDTVDPALIKRGVRLFVFILDRLIKVYGKYEARINAVVSPGVASAMGALLSALADIDALNRPGPE